MALIKWPGSRLFDRGRRIDVRRYVAATIAVLLVFGVVIALYRLFVGEPDSIVINVVPVTGTDTVAVQVAGEVRDPGVVQVPAGSSVRDTINAAGGPTENADIESLNVEAVVNDGDFLLVTTRQEIAQVAPVDLNQADQSALEALPGIGPVLAARIIEYRDRRGAFTTIEELADISGISDRMVEDLRPLVIVEGD